MRHLSRALLFAMLTFLVWTGVTKALEDRAAPATTAETDSDKFLRFVERPEEERAALETVIATYEDDDGHRVDLVGAVHIGDVEYFQLLNTVFRAYDSVLYEMVKPKDMPMPSKSESGGGSPVSTMQRAMKDFLELEFQLDGVDYQAKNFVHADLDPQTFFRLMDEKGESIFTLVLQAMLSEWQAGSQNQDTQAMPAAMLFAMMTKDRARHMKYILGQQFGELERISAGFEKGLNGEDSVLIVERNKAALVVLKEQLDKGDKRIAIYYGAAHLPDMERRLLKDFGMRRTNNTWLTAWDIERAPREVSSGDDT